MPRAPSRARRSKRLRNAKRSRKSQARKRIRIRRNARYRSETGYIAKTESRQEEDTVIGQKEDATHWNFEGVPESVKNELNADDDNGNVRITDVDRMETLLTKHGYQLHESTETYKEYKILIQPFNLDEA